MKLIKADFDRRLPLAGVPEPVERPVAIDRTQTGFGNLRSLRIYRFLAQSVIDGHAEEDEVLIVVMRGTVDLTMSDGGSLKGKHPVMLSAFGEESHPCAAYLPPNGAYKLIPRTDAEIAYARATPSGRGSPPRVFKSKFSESGGVLLEEMNYAERLRIRVLQVNGATENRTFSARKDSEANSETLIHMRTTPAAGVAMIRNAGIPPLESSSLEPIALESWDTVAVAPGERPMLEFVRGASAIVLAVFVG